ncbi:MAG: hypothetical protein LBQ54_05085 [Planctomycetaceae bacterium]|nr:hypothetical protein [Planctomycetaceae bacterium]
MPPAANARALDPCREPRQAVASQSLRDGRHQIEKSFQLEAEDMSEGNACLSLSHHSPLDLNHCCFY